MSRLIPASERILRARNQIQKARNLPVPEEAGWRDFSYVAQVKDIIQQGRDLIKFIPYSPSASAEMKDEVRQLFLELDQAEKEILHR
ncbi:MAG: hypothetical protein M1281_00635 [Chloroflexi bacterium]|nr:hypothetical protein [Chloroflexota bacterium]